MRYGVALFSGFVSMFVSIFCEFQAGAVHQLATPPPWLRTCLTQVHLLQPGQCTHPPTQHIREHTGNGSRKLATASYVNTAEW
jgi:hypothetical protein